MRKRIVLSMIWVLLGLQLTGCTTAKIATLQGGVVGDALLLPITLPMAIAQDLGANTPLEKKYCCSSKSYSSSSSYSKRNNNQSSWSVTEAGNRPWK